MRAAALIVLVHEWDHDGCVRRSAGVAEREVGLGSDRLTIVVSEAQRVDQGRGVLELAIETDDRRLAIAFDRSARSDGVDDHLRQRLAEDRSNFVDGGLQILDIAEAGPRVLHHRKCRVEAQRRRRCLAALDGDRLHLQKGLSDLDGQESRSHFRFDSLTVLWYTNILLSIAINGRGRGLWRADERV